MKLVMVIDSNDFSADEFAKLWQQAKFIAVKTESRLNNEWGINKPVRTCYEDNEIFMSLISEAAKM